MDWETEKWKLTANAMAEENDKLRGAISAFLDWYDDNKADERLIDTHIATLRALKEEKK